MDNISFTQRMVGAIILLSLAIIFVPMLLEKESEISGEIRGTNIPSMPDNVSTIVFQLDDEKLFQELGKQVDAGQSASMAQAKKNLQSPAAGQKPDSVVEESSQQQQIESSKAIDPDLTTWMIQLGSFSNEKNALGLRDELRAKGYTSFIQQSRTQNGIIWQVRVGPELDPKKAQKKKRLLEKETGLKALVLRHQG